MQVLESGGDCADKSRLLTAMLREVAIPSTMAMCFHPRTGQPTHTVVEARVETGYMVLDPTWDLCFPREGEVGYYGLLDLRRDPNILFRRLARLTPAAPPTDKIHHYNREDDVYDAVSTFNWHKNRCTCLLFVVLRSIWADEVYRLSRPTWIEEPKLTVAVIALVPGLLASGLFLVVTILSRRRRRLRSQMQTTDTPT